MRGPVWETVLLMALLSSSWLPQVALTCTQIWWTTEVGTAFARLEEGYENAMKDYYRKQVAQLKTLITMLIGPLSQGDRQKVMTVCTVDVHARDVVAKMIAQKVRPGHFQRVPPGGQLHHEWWHKGDARMQLKHGGPSLCAGQRTGRESWWLFPANECHRSSSRCLRRGGPSSRS